MGSMIKLKSLDGVVFDVDVEIVKHWRTLKTMLDDLGMEDSSEEIPLPNVDSLILEKVISWTTYHKEDLDLLSAEDKKNEENRTVDICVWDVDFLRIDQETLFEVMLAANYLDISQLLQLCSKHVANMIRGKSPDEIRKTFNITNDFKTGEEDKIHRENKFQ